MSLLGETEARTLKTITDAERTLHEQRRISFDREKDLHPARRELAQAVQAAETARRDAARESVIAEEEAHKLRSAEELQRHQNALALEREQHAHRLAEGRQARARTWIWATVATVGIAAVAWGITYVPQRIVAMQSAAAKPEALEARIEALTKVAERALAEATGARIASERVVAASLPPASAPGDTSDRTAPSKQPPTP